MTNYSCGIHINSPNTLCALSLRLKHSCNVKHCSHALLTVPVHLHITWRRHLLPRNKPNGGLSCSEILPQWQARAAALSPLWSLLSRGDYCRDDTPAAPSWWETSPMLFIFKYISPQAPSSPSPCSHSRRVWFMELCSLFLEDDFYDRFIISTKAESFHLPSFFCRGN